MKARGTKSCSAGSAFALVVACHISSHRLITPHCACLCLVASLDPHPRSAHRKRPIFHIRPDEPRVHFVKQIRLSFRLPYSCRSTVSYTITMTPLSISFGHFSIHLADSPFHSRSLSHSIYRLHANHRLPNHRSTFDEGQEPRATEG